MDIIHIVNENTSDTEFHYRPRWIAPLVQAAAADHPVVVLSGARQVGKSTFLQHEPPFSSWRYVSLDDFDALRQAERDPSALWAGADQVVLDEVQRAPALLSSIKQTVDQRRRKVRFVLSGSANLLLMRRVSESLAGRAVYFSLLPMTMGEMRLRPASDLLFKLLKGQMPAEGRVTPTTQDLAILMLRGFMPPVLTLSRPETWIRWWEGYVVTYLERDLRQLSQIEALPDFRRVMRALALRSGQMLNQTEVSRDTGVSQPTVHRYLNLLETTGLLERLPAFARNRTKRLIKSPKIYWVDPGVAAYLAGHHEASTLRSSREAGGVFETLVLLHLRVLSELLVPRARLHYWRTVTGKEVDFVVEQGRRLVAIEVKLSSNLHYDDTEGLRLFLEEYPETVTGVLLYAGNTIRYFHEKIVAVPWRLLAGG
jgi:predicted AAA+ superfamily ATPase